MSMQNIEDIYPLSPMQQGMLFHTLYAPTSGVYVAQVSFSLDGDLDTRAFEGAWQQVLDHHAIFRSACVWEDLEEPLQVVYRRLDLRMNQHDWRALSPSEQEERLESFLSQDQARGFDLSNPPLMRLALFRLADLSYRAVWTHHHLLIDGWSLPLIFNEVFSIYKAMSRGEEVRLERSRPYRDYIAWLHKQDLGQAEAYWRSTLDGFTSPTRLSIDKESAGIHSQPRYEETQIKLTEETTRRLREIGRENHLTLNTMMSGAWAIMLSRYSQEKDVVFGTTVSGRPGEIEGVEKMVGLFINTLPVRVEVRGEEGVVEWMRKEQEKQVEMRQYEYSPLVQVQRWSQVPRSLPLFETLLAFQNYPMEESLRGREGSLRVSRFQVNESNNYPLVVRFLPGPQLLLQFVYDCGRFDAAAIKRLKENLKTLLESMAADPHQRLRDLSMLTDQERRQLLIEWNETHVPHNRELSVYELFEEQAAKNPNALAVASGPDQITYRELNEKTNQLAHYLKAMGAGRDDLVAVCMDRSIDMVVALLAILKTGAAYVPMDPAYPLERLGFMLEDAQATVLLTSEHLLDLMPSSWAQVICLDSDWDQIASYSRENLEKTISYQDLAYVIYTSGSTGKPKGVEITHGGLTNLVSWHKRVYSLLPTDRATLLAGVGFDASVWELWPYLSSGASIHIPDEQTRTNPSMLIDWLNGQQITLSFMATPLAEAVMSQEESRELSLRAMLTGGDKLRGRAKRGSSYRLMNHYGPTESTVVATYSEVEREGGREIGEPSIGRGIDNVEVYVLGEEMEVVGVGMAGELYIGGVQLARGYVGRADHTAERFVPNPFSKEPGERLYRTGDKARYLESGEIEFLGRMDHQVKVRGYRIELGEVEAALREEAGVSEAVAIVKQEQGEDKRLIGYVVGSKEEVSGSEIRRRLKQRIPDYMVPTRIVILDRLPLTPNGKVDRKGLEEMEEESVAEEMYIAPRNAIEETMAGIWGEVLGVARVGVEDDFFELGGHSLLATQVIFKAQAAFKVEVTLRTLFDRPTVAGMSQQIEWAVMAERGSQQARVGRVSRDEDLPLSFAQQRLWFIDQMEPGSTAYNISASIRHKGRLDSAVLDRCLNELVDRHEVLRTVFAIKDGRPIQIILPALRLAIEEFDLRDFDAFEREIEAKRLAAAEARRPFDLATGPLLRVSLLRQDDAEYVLLLNMHHIISDGWSIDILLRELTQLYEAHSTGGPARLPDLPIQYADFAHWQRGWLQGEVLDEHLAYWKQQLAGIPDMLELPCDKTRPAVQSFRGAYTSFELSDALSRKLVELSKQEGVTLFMTLLTAFTTLLHRYTGQTDIVVGTPVANRSRFETEGLIGFFVNTLALRANMSERPSFRQALNRVRDVTLGAYAHQDLPFERLVDELQPVRDLSRSPIFQVMFALQNASGKEFNLEGSSPGDIDSNAGGSKFDLTLHMMESAPGIAGVFEYSTDLFEAGTIARMSAHFQNLLEGLVTNPDRQISMLPMMTDSEQRQVLTGWNQARPRHHEDLCVHERFQRQARQTPENGAVVFGGDCLSYRELNEKANQLAHYLQELGVGPDAVVALYAERSIEMVIAILAVLKSGGAYLPLDVAYPKERVAYMLEDSQARVLLTQRPLLDRVPDGDRPVVCLDADWDEIGRQSKQDPTSRVTPDNLAYVIYTSGSTGKSKGVLVNHANVIRLFEATQGWFSFSERDVWTLFHSHAFDFSVWEIWGALLYGGKLVVVPYWISRSPEAFRRLLHEEQVTVLNQTPSAFRQLIFADELAGEGEGLALRLVIFGGEALEMQSLRPWFERHGDSKPQLVNMYGITETTVHVTYRPLTMADLSGPARSVIGGPMPDLQVYITDRDLQLVPVGVPGEILVGGAGLARGYLNRAELTSERFIANPFTDEPGARLYRSGDLARFLPGGDIEYLGRIDHQVKIRGFRIELGEIEAALRQHPSIKDAAVVVHRGEDDSRLVGYVVFEEGGELDLGQVKDYLGRRLPDFMLINSMVRLDELPLTANGKLNRAALPAPGPTRVDSREYVAPRNSVELRLVRIWEDVLGIDGVGVRDNFFALGGHSLMAVRLMANVEQAFGEKLPLASLFRRGTIEEMAEALMTEERSDIHSSLVELKPAGSLRPFFCVHPVGGNVLCYADLSRRLPADLPVYGLQARGLAGGQPFDSDIEMMAAHYIDELREAQPQGPYSLGGWSMGGIVAFEMARQLQAQGQEVALLALIDSHLPTGEESRPDEDEAGLMAGFARDLGMGMDEATALWEGLAKLAQQERLPFLLEQAKLARVATSYMDLSQLGLLYEAFKTNVTAMMRYEPAPYSGRVTLFKAGEETGGEPQGPERRWESLAGGGLQVHVVPGDHYTILARPNIQVLADRLTDSLVEADFAAAAEAGLSLTQSQA